MTMMTTMLQQLYDDVLTKKKIKLTSLEFSKILQKTLSGHSCDYERLCCKGDNSISNRKATANTQGSNEFHENKSHPLNCSVCVDHDVNKQRRIHNDTERGKMEIDHNEEYDFARRKEILLTLTCMKMIVENVSQNDEEVEEEPEVLEVLRNKDILSTLLDLFESEDKFVSYAALKSTKSILTWSKFKDFRDTLLRDVVERILATTKFSHQERYLDLLKHLMANQSGLDINRWCFERLQSYDIFTPGFAEHILSDTETLIEGPHNYLHLLQKTIKYLNKLKTNERLNEIQALVPQIEVVVRFLLVSIQNVNRMRSRLLLRKVLDVFHELLNYSDLAKVKVIHCLYRQTVDRLLSVISPAVLQSMPFKQDWVGFGGSRTEGREFDIESGDLPLLRKLILLLLKSCAISVRSNSERGAAIVPECIASLDKVVCKSLPSAPRDIEWLPLVFSDQDDDWIESLLCLLDVYLHSKRSSHKTSPHKLFLQFLDGNSRDHMMLVDLLTSPETCFLVYFLRYLKCVVVEWTQFVDECHMFFIHEHRAVDSQSDSELQLDGLFDFTIISKKDKTGDSGNSVVVCPESFDIAKSTENFVSTQNSPRSKCEEIIGPCAAKKVKFNSVNKPGDTSVDSKGDNSLCLGSSKMSKAGESNQHKVLFQSAASETKLEGLACLTVYGTGSDSSDDDCQDAMDVSLETCKPEMKVSRQSFCLRADTCESSEKDSNDVCNKESFSEFQDKINVFNPSQKYNDQSDTKLSRSKIKLKPPPGGSTKPCDLQCVELVMSVLIRVRLRIERLSDQDIFPYNPSPLLSLIEQCEAFYEDMHLLV